mmetsp:Transcript_18211/g.21855  ORF Transcript_18211/g.21855 Transcript_18211/m.21855 type:complete len:773 (+) Transcript_18211:316-2634(+)|eukprot:CAMPEP_0197850154 /NCGR_PEP_ID=MMETSP1438-20131217/14406_1 /TAXON_ID=1461541 /ORGANISM="Pterosperma sp., Strain CCMP1384" /LENGTH=772 /DNA_ID=CAMNT_0043463147 /DNA_START=309 /DNA_END=2627 /DNA_ORIENTATION=+
MPLCQVAVPFSSPPVLQREQCLFKATQARRQLISVKTLGSRCTKSNTFKGRAVQAKVTRSTSCSAFPQRDGEERTARNGAITPALSTDDPQYLTQGLSALPGQPIPLGPSLPVDGSMGVNFAVFSKNAASVTLLVLADEAQVEPSEFECQRTDDTWHVQVDELPGAGVRYAYRVTGHGGWEQGYRWCPEEILLDPYAPLVHGRSKWGVGDPHQQWWGTFDLSSPEFDWGEDYEKPDVPWQDSVIYEMPVRAFTADGSSGLDPSIAGSYAGVAAKIDHLKDLGVTAVELLPVHEYDELEFQRMPNDRDHMINTWGYSTVNFFAPMSRYGSGGRGPAAAANEFKSMVKELHNAGIEVILDVVYNHTAEGGDVNPYILSFRGIDAKEYYMMDMDNYVQMCNYSGCGNTINANNPPVTQMIVDSLRHWVLEYHVDGFRFDLASALCRDPDGQPMASPPLIRQISKDPVLSQVKLISEPWDCGGLYQVGSFPNWDIWAEWNGKYRDSIRNFIKGTSSEKKQFASRISGSSDLYHYHQRKPYHSINFVTAHDGFTLKDLVSYNSKHNEANGENGMDGSNDNLSWNCGVEGSTSDEGINALRKRQMRNMHMALMVSQGTPMVVMGDEYGLTRHGNNNAYGHDNELTHFMWGELEARRDNYFRFYSGMIHFRQNHPLLGRTEFLEQRDVTFHEDNWDDEESRFLAFTLHGGGKGDLYIAFNAHHFIVDAALPSAPEGTTWHRIVDTNLPSPRDFIPEGRPGIEGRYNIAPFSVLMLQAQQ